MPDEFGVKPIKSVDSEGNTYVFTATVDRDGDRGFTKVFLSKLGGILEKCSASDNKLLVYLTKKGSTGKPVSATLNQIAADLGLNRKTVKTSMSFFLEKDLIRRNSLWAIYLNPEMIFKGRSYLREEALQEYKLLDGPKDANNA